MPWGLEISFTFTFFVAISREFFYMEVLMKMYNLQGDLFDRDIENKVFNDTRKHYFHANTMKDLFEIVQMDNVLSFLKETGLYQKI